MNGNLVDNLLVSVATILLLLGTEVHFKQYLFKWAIPMIVVGIVILVLGKIIIKDLQTSFLKRFLTTASGIIILLVGIEYFLEQHMELYWWLYIAIGLLLFQYHRTITNKVTS